jgi:Fe-S-cluster containining protein
LLRFAPGKEDEPEFELSPLRELPYCFREQFMTIGRNDPCPCGSGRKYKKCCGGSEATAAVGATTQSAAAAMMEYFALNEAMAYKGKIGKSRADFCQEYIARKQTALKEIERDQTEQTVAHGEKITCHKGCSLCCTQYILGTLQECDAIVNYLYQHPDVLAVFMNNYPTWRNGVKQHEAAFQAMKAAVDRQIREGITEANTQDYDEANVRFMMLNLQCPFLNKEGACSIHEVRPWNCAKPVATTPKEWCNPHTNKENKKPTVYVSDLVPEEMPYFRPTKALNVMSVNIGVWQILTESYTWLSQIPGLEGLNKEAMLDPEVQDVVAEFMDSK